MPFDEPLAARIRLYFEQQKLPFEEKRMMGGLCFMVRGKMCVGVEKTRLMARLDPAIYETALQRPGCAPMDFTGKPLRGFVYLQPQALRTDPDLHAWLDLALDFNPRAKSSKKPARK